MLTKKMMAAAEYRVLHPTETTEKIAKEVGVDPSSIYKWQKKEEFQEYEHKLCQQRFRNAEKIAMQKMIELADRGNYKAVQYLLDGAGYKAEEKVSVSGSEISITISDED